MRIDPQDQREMVSRTRRRREPRPWLQLLNCVLTLAGERAELLRHSEKPWASVTFSGTRHLVALSFEGSEGAVAAEEFIAALPDHEFVIPGKLVADAAIVSLEETAGPERRVTLEAELLLLDEL